MAFSTEASYIEISYKDLLEKAGSKLPYKNEDLSYYSVKSISFNFRTLQTKPGILLHITLKAADQLYFEIMLKNEYELEFAYPHNGELIVGRFGVDFFGSKLV